MIKDCSAGSFVNASRLHTNKSVFNNVEQTDTVLAAELVKSLNELYAVHLFAVQRSGDTLFKVYCNICGLVGSLLG